MQGRLAIVVCLLLPLVGCRGMLPFHATRRAQPASELPIGYELSAGRLLIHSNFDVPDGRGVARELTSEGDNVCETLGLPCSETPINVYLFRDAQSYGECLASYFPNVPARRAFFMESDGQLAVYAHWSDRVAEDLRHEVAHGYLHAAVSGLPLWLDEGLAEYFEVPRSQGGLNTPHVDLLNDLLEHNGWRPDLERLERLTDVSQMDQPSYAEAWAWVYFMLHSRPERHDVLTRYMLDLASPAGPREAISRQLSKTEADPAQSLVSLLIGLKKPD